MRESGKCNYLILPGGRGFGERHSAGKRGDGWGVVEKFAEADSEPEITKEGGQLRTSSWGTLAKFS
jgi:hypothetical protein